MSEQPEITVRRAEASDAQEIIRLIDALAAFVKAPPTRLTADEIRRDGFGPEARLVCFLAELDGRAVGYALAYPGFSSDHGGRGLHLADLYVEQGLRGQGVGRDLMAAVARHGRGFGALWMVWDVWVENRSAKSFYRALGAKPYPEVEIMVLKNEALDRLAGSDG